MPQTGRRKSPLTTPEIGDRISNFVGYVAIRLRASASFRAATVLLTCSLIAHLLTGSPPVSPHSKDTGSAAAAGAGGGDDVICSRAQGFP